MKKFSFNFEYPSKVKHFSYRVYDLKFNTFFDVADSGSKGMKEVCKICNCISDSLYNYIVSYNKCVLQQRGVKLYKDRYLIFSNRKED